VATAAASGIRTSRGLRTRGSASGPWLALGLAVAAATAVMVRLSGPPTLDPDEYANALYFDRLIHVRRLEDLLLSTPKPLLTVVDGLAWAVTHDWRAITVLTVAVFALAVTLLARAAACLGGVPAALAVAIALVGSGPLILQVGRGNSSIWGLAGWAVAADALARPRRRWGVAAAALLLAGLARPESWLLLPPAALLGLVAWRHGERGALLLLVPLAAPLLWLGHDWALTADPLHSFKVPEHYTELVSGRHVIPPLDWTARVGRRYGTVPRLTAPALLGVAFLLWRRAWLWLAGLGILIVGVLGMLGVEAWRGTYISFRYFDPPDVGMRLLAALGAAWLGAAAAALSRIGRKRWRTTVAALVGVVLAVAVFWPLDHRIRSISAVSARLSSTTEVAIGALRPVVREPGSVVAVPISQRPRVSLELGIPLTRVRDLYLGTLRRPVDRVLAGTVAVYSYQDGPVPSRRLAALSTSVPRRIGDLEVTPRLVDPSIGLYVLDVAPAQAVSH
jgi:hypothetical protein